MLPDGDTIAASNFDQAGQFVGENFAYRPYFQDAIAGNRGRFFALGTTSLKRGYYFSSPILVGSEIRGVVVFKVDIDAIEASWKRRRKRDLRLRSRRHHLHDRPAGMALRQPPAADAGADSLVPRQSRRYADAESEASCRQRRSRLKRRLCHCFSSPSDGNGANTWYFRGHAGCRLDGACAARYALGARAGRHRRHCCSCSCSALPRLAGADHPAAPRTACRAHGDAGERARRTGAPGRRNAPPILRWSTGSSKPKWPNAAPPNSSCGRRKSDLIQAGKLAALGPDVGGAVA